MSAKVRYIFDIPENQSDSPLDDYTINDIYKSDENFGDFIVSLINFFIFNKEEDKIINLIEVREKIIISKGAWKN
jgi:hypothetical protein